MTYTYLDCLAMFGVGGAHPGGLQLTKKLLAEEKINAQTKLLDAGCGTGQTAAFIAQQYGCPVSAVDCSTIMVEKAKQRFAALDLPIDVKIGDTENLSYSDNSYDIVLSESVASFTDTSSTIPEFKRVLKPNGLLLAIETVLEETISKEEINQIKNFYGFPALLTASEWHTAFSSAGFTQIESTRYSASVDQIDEEHAADFLLSEYIDDELLDIFEKHEEIIKLYKDKLGFRIFRCR